MSQTVDIDVRFHFALFLSDELVGYFAECAGMGAVQQVIKRTVITETGNEIVMKLPGWLKWGNITLKRGIVSGMDLWQWRKQVECDIEEAYRDGSILIYGDTMENVLAQWNFQQAWPTKIMVPQSKPDSNELMVNELTIVHHGIERIL